MPVDPKENDIVDSIRSAVSYTRYKEWRTVMTKQTNEMTPLCSIYDEGLSDIEESDLLSVGEDF